MRRRLENYAPRSLRTVAILVVPMIGAFIAILFLASKGGWPLYFAITVFAGCLIIGKGIEIYKFHSFCCPECNESLSKPGVVEGETIRFTCSRCRIIWDTGHQVAESSA